MRRLRHLLACLLLAAAAAPAHAVITCTFGSVGQTIPYVNGTSASRNTTVVVNCNRTEPTDPTSITVAVTADLGANASSGTRRARLFTTANYLAYTLHTANNCGGQAWTGVTAVTGTVNWGVFPMASTTLPVSLCIAPQTATGTGRHGDMVGLTLTTSSGATGVSTWNIGIHAPASCTLTQPPGTIALVYAGFSPVAVTGTTNFSTTCTTTLPYTMAVSPAGGTLAGVGYTLGLSASGGTGTAAAQAYTITATAPAGQAGACAGASCTATQVHTLTISY